jgi:leishmanolysin-like peptidase
MVLIACALPLIQGHNRIHDEIEHPPIVRNYMSRPEYLEQPDFSQRRLEYLDYFSQRRFEGRYWDGSAGDSGSTYDESVCTTTGAETKQSLRLTLKKSDLSGLTTEYATYLENVLMPEVKSYFEATFTVARLTTNLKVVTTGAVAPLATSGVTVDATDNDPGIAGTDYLLYYSATNSDTCTANTLAYASLFEVTGCDRPLVGYIHFCPGGITTMDTSSIAHAQQLSTAKHELIHALGFSSRLYPYYRNSDMSPRTPRNTATGVPNTATLTVPLSNTGNDDAGTATLWTPSTDYFAGASDPVLGGTRYKFKSTKVLEKARQHFGCSSLDGIEVENQGGSGNWGSHWEKRIIGNEAMSAVVDSVTSPVSAITLALFEDMGFWGVNYAQADDFPHMQNAGCDTVTKQCLTNGASINSKYFCNADSSIHACTFNGAAIGGCNKGTQSGLASYYYHFGDTSTAGNQFYADYCPTVTYFSNRICTNTADAQDADQYMGAEFGSSSRCFSSSLFATRYSLQEKTAGCYKYQCLSSSAMQISVYYSQTQSFTVDCTSATAGNVMQVPNFNGGLTCPNPAEITVCGAETSYTSLSGLTITSGSTDLNNQLVPAFSEFETNYRLNLGSAIESLDLTPTTTSASGVTTEYTVDGVTQAAPASGTTYSTALQGYKTLKFKITRTISSTSSTVGQSTTREYTIGVSRGTGDSTTKTVKLTLSLDYASVSADMPLFRTEVTNEVVSVLSLRNSAQVELYTVVEGSVVIQFTLLAGSTTDPDPSSIDATLQALFNDKNSALFDSTKYSYLSYATVYGSSEDFVPCVDSSGAQTCSAENCNIETGSCINSDGGGDDFPSWAIYVVAGVGALIAAVVIFCLVKHFCCCCASKGSSSSGGTTSTSRKSHFSVDRPSDSRNAQQAAIMMVQPVVPEPKPEATKPAQKGKFSDMIQDSDSSDDEGQSSQDRSEI